jgi:protein-glutamine gamma-glutamyltransferase
MTAAKPLLNHSALTLLVITQCGLSIPHFQYLPFWIPLLGMALAALRWGGSKGLVPLLPRWAKIFVTLLAAAGIVFSFGTFMGREAGTATLIVMLGLKLHELHAKRDLYFSLILNYFLIAATFLYSQTPFVALGMIAATWITTALMIRINHPLEDGLSRHDFHMAGKMLLQSIPLMLALFILFPRIPGPLWSLPKDAHTGSTGLGDRIKPGSISTLTQNNAIAFRVQFEDAIPFPQELYWRGPTFLNYDGEIWFIEKPTPSQLRHSAEQWIIPQGKMYSYSVTLEPHQQNWLFTLDAPLEVFDIPSDFSPDLLVSSPNKITERIRYRAVSYPVFRTSKLLSEEERAAALFLPPRKHPRTRTLGAQIRARHATAQARVDAALTMFHEEPFAYSLNPPPLGKDSIDSFLFETRKGFCEHYASAFTTLMRAAGIPARLVAGYQGGDINPVGNYLIVRQADAHAWSEVWLDERGWTRVDPTGAVAPNRIEMGVESAVADPEALPLMARKHAPWLRNLQYRIDAMQNAWNQWVIGYGQTTQAQFLKQFGLQNTQHMAFAMIAAIVLFLVTWAIYVLWRQREMVDPIQQAYLRFCRIAAKQTGLVRGLHEGAADYAYRLIHAYPAQRDTIEPITTLYHRLRYGPNPHLSDHQALLKQIKRVHFTPQQPSKPAKS